MSTTIKYKNLYGEDITLQQLPNVADYDKLQYENGNVKRIDSYYDKKLDSGTYYLSSNEDKQAIVLEFSNIWMSTEIYLNTQSMGNFILREWEAYGGTNLLSKGKTLFDNQDRRIATEFLDINSSQIKSVEKKFYLTLRDEFIDTDGLPDFGQLSFYYKEDLTIVEINLLGFEDDNYRITDNENILNNLLIRPLFKWEDHPYYHSASPLIPNSLTI
ncbi:hypothetical protein G6M26_23445 [Agrobacterium tumefaciens]|nr:hypothetical protein [Agrobacterium tumefaciens]NTE21498.1 hypothetical protein [Agrobacterium tumefaciens]